MKMPWRSCIAVLALVWFAGCTPAASEPDMGETAQMDSAPDAAPEDSGLLPDASATDMPDATTLEDMKNSPDASETDMPEDASTDLSVADVPPDMPDMCALDCACDGYCTNGVVTILGMGEGWEGPCGEEPECAAPSTYQCPNGCAAGAPMEGGDPTISCPAARKTFENDWSAFCAPE